MHISFPIAFAAAFQVARAVQGNLVVNDDPAFGADTFGHTGLDIKVPPSFWGTISKTANVSISVPVTGYSVTSPYNNQTLDGWTLKLYIQENIPAGGGAFVAGSAIQLVAPDSQKTDAMADWEICAWVGRTPNAKGAATANGSCDAVAPNNCLQKKVADFLANPKCWGVPSQGYQDPCVPMSQHTASTGRNFNSRVEGHNQSTTTWAQYIETANATHAAGDSSDYDDLVNDIYVVGLKWYKSYPNFDRDASSPDSPGQPSDIPALGQVVCLSTKNSNGSSSDSKSDKSGAAGVAVSVGFGLAAALGAAIFAL